MALGVIVTDQSIPSIVSATGETEENIRAATMPDTPCVCIIDLPPQDPPFAWAIMPENTFEQFYQWADEPSEIEFTNIHVL